MGLCAVVFGSILLDHLAPSRELWSHNGERALLVLRCEREGLVFYAARPHASGLAWDEINRRALGFRFEQSAYVAGRSFELTVPHWAWAGTVLALFVFLARRFPRGSTCGFPLVHATARQDFDPGVSHVCGYDLRATPERCPECGSIPVVTMSNRAPVQPRA